MFQLPSLNVGKLMQLIVQNFELKVDSSLSKRHGTVRFLAQVEDARQARYELFSIAEKLKAVATRRNLVLSDESTVRHFIECQTKFPDKFLYMNNPPIAAHTLNSINKKILQRVLKSRRAGPGKKTETRTGKNGSWFGESKLYSLEPRFRYGALGRNTSYVSLFKGGHGVNCNRLEKKEERGAKKDVRDSFAERRTKESSAKKRTQFKCNLKEGILKYAREELEAAQSFMRLYSKEVEYIRTNVRVALHISTKELKSSGISRGQYDQVVLLCHRAILCLTEPSENASVFLEGELRTVIEDRLSKAHDYHFDSQRGYTGSYRGVLILSECARVLVKHTNTSMIRTIAGILRCGPREILILSSRE